VPPQERRSGVDRRDNSLQGIMRRRKFEDSLDLLRTLGLSSHAIEHYRWFARETRRLPHELVREMVEENVKRADMIVAAALSSGRPA